MPEQPSPPPQQQMAVKVTKMDRPELGETFADSIESLYFDGQSMRIEFCVTRLEHRPNEAPSGRRYPACRLVLTPGAGMELMKQMQQVTTELIKAGVLKPTPTPAAAPSRPAAKEKEKEGKKAN